MATAAPLRRHHPEARCYLLNSGDLSEDLEGIDVVSGDAQDRWTWWWLAERA
ncbi:MAG: hypothetical protein Ct9H300mP31_07080 [Acidimicrobiaceae bacterium]|nr:MAG: hypothetical protein Ct9H300mP31_07080 [Acidimicrobiaceae bacterium]